MGAPADNDYTKIYSTTSAFAALKSDGSITVWGHSDFGGSGAPTDSGYTKIYSNDAAFATLEPDGQRQKKLNKFWYSHGQRVNLFLL
jgi:hypothetical protein